MPDGRTQPPEKTGEAGKAMSGPAMWEREFTVDSNMLDMNSVMRASDILREFQQTGMDHLDAAGHGLALMDSIDEAFLLSKNSVRICRAPRYGERLTAQTCIPRVKGLFSVRYYRLLDADGGTVADAMSYWTSVRISDRMILRPGHHDDSYIPMTEAFTVGACPPSRIDLPEDAAPCGQRTVRYTDVDQYGHMNNARYADVICEFMPGGMKDRRIASLDMTYSHEAPEGSLLDISAAAVQEKSVFAFDCADRRIFTATASVCGL